MFSPLQVHQFEALFTDLENQKHVLGITSFGASVTTMEEVFLKVGEDVDETLRIKLQQKIDLSAGSPVSDPSKVSNQNDFLIICKEN